MTPTGNGKMAYPYGDYDALLVKEVLHDVSVLRHRIVGGLCLLYVLMIGYLIYDKLTSKPEYRWKKGGCVVKSK